MQTPEEKQAWLDKCLAALIRIGHLTQGGQTETDREVWQIAFETVFPPTTDGK